MNPVLHPKCVAANPGAASIKCLFAEHLAPHISTPIFHMGSRYDSWQLDNQLFTNATKPVIGYGEAFMQRINASILSQPKNAAFVDSCVHHCNAFNSIRIDKLTVAEAFSQWFPFAH